MDLLGCWMTLAGDIWQLRCTPDCLVKELKKKSSLSIFLCGISTNTPLAFNLKEESCQPRVFQFVTDPPKAALPFSDLLFYDLWVLCMSMYVFMCLYTRVLLCAVGWRLPHFLWTLIFWDRVSGWMWAALIKNDKVASKPRAPPVFMPSELELWVQPLEHSLYPLWL